jgi:hypothetical protein
MLTNTFSILGETINPSTIVEVTVDGTVVPATVLDSQVVISAPVAAGSLVDIKITNTNYLADGMTFRLEVNKLNEQKVYRVPAIAKTTLTSALDLTSTEISLDDVAGFVGARVLLINGERIFYSAANVSTNKLTGLIRGINGTAINPSHPAGTEVTVVSDLDMLPAVYINESWSSMHDPIKGEAIQLSDTPAAKFLQKP